MESSSSIAADSAELRDIGPLFCGDAAGDALTSPYLARSSIVFGSAKAPNMVATAANVLDGTTLLPIHDATDTDNLNHARSSDVSDSADNSRSCLPQEPQREDSAPVMGSSTDRLDSRSTHFLLSQTSQKLLERQQHQSIKRQRPITRALPKLTLSAFRRPEHTVRLTKSDPNRRLGAEYDLHAPGCRVLGHGAFSTVRLAVRKHDNVQVAVKTIAKHEALRSRRLRVSGRRYMEEWEILRRLQNHPNIISLLDVFETNEEIQLVMEYCPGGELYDAIQKKKQHQLAVGNRTTASDTVTGASAALSPRSSSQACRRAAGQCPERQAAQITSQILRALVDIHAMGIVHRDIKAENILLMSPDRGDDSGYVRVKLCDFGMARLLDQETSPSTVTVSSSPTSGSSGSDGDCSPITPRISRSYSIVGSSYYMAPEVEIGDGYCASMDVYSLGVTLYILLCGFPPVFAAPNDGKQNSGSDSDSGSESDDSSNVMFPNVYWKDVSEEAKGLVRKMLNRNPSKRVSAKEALADPWIVKHTNTVAERRTLSATSVTVKNSRTGRTCDVDLEVVRRRLRQSLVNRARRRASTGAVVPANAANTKRKRRDTVNRSSFGGLPHPHKRMRRPSSCLMALADLYRGMPAHLAVQSTSTSGKTATSASKPVTPTSAGSTIASSSAKKALEDRIAPANSGDASAFSSTGGDDSMRALSDPRPAPALPVL